jgi:hypothetical protein
MFCYEWGKEVRPRPFSIGQLEKIKGLKQRFAGT